MSRTWIQELKIAFLSMIIVPPLNFARFTWQVSRHAHPEAEALIAQKKPVIYAIWHGRMYCILRGIPPETAILISRSRDGEMIARVADALGLKKAVRGSYQRGGVSAMREMLRALTQEKTSLVFTVDGPRGPREQVKPGVIKLAGQAGVPIIPVIPSSQHLLHKFTKAWDHFHAPQFFTPMHIFYGRPIVVPSGLVTDAQLEQYRLELEDAMFRLTQEADSLVQRSHVSAGFPEKIKQTEFKKDEQQTIEGPS